MVIVIACDGNYELWSGSGGGNGGGAPLLLLYLFRPRARRRRRSRRRAAKTNRAPTNKKINSARQLIFGRCFQLFFFTRRLGLIWPRALNKRSPIVQTES
jgi:hypothetical protein